MSERAFRHALASLRLEIAAQLLWLAFRKYRPDQPRVSAGVPEGGQWTDDSGARRRVAANRFRLTPQLEQECEEQYAADTFHCSMVGLRACHAAAAERYAACRTGRPIPPLSY
jgi:hypothetical protein